MTNKAQAIRRETERVAVLVGKFMLTAGPASLIYLIWGGPFGFQIFATVVVLTICGGVAYNLLDAEAKKAEKE